MFTVTDEDRRLRAEGQSWRKRCQANLVQESERFVYQERPKDDSGREDAILHNSLGTILQERIALLRLIYREDRLQMTPEVRVLVSQRAIEEAMGSDHAMTMSEEDVRALISSFISEDFRVSDLIVGFDGTGRSLTCKGMRYTEFYLAIPGRV